VRVRDDLGAKPLGRRPGVINTHPDHDIVRRCSVGAFDDVPVGDQVSVVADDDARPAAVGSADLHGGEERAPEAPFGSR